MDPGMDTYGNAGPDNPTLVQTHIDSHFRIIKRAYCKECGVQQYVRTGESSTNAKSAAVQESAAPCAAPEISPTMPRAHVNRPYPCRVASRPA